MNLYTAANQWARRPDDERFATLSDLLAYTQGERTASAQSLPMPFETLKVIADGAAVGIQGAVGRTAALSHFAFGQVSQIAHAPAEFLRTLNPETAATVLNERLATIDQEVDKRDLRILFRTNGTLVVRAITSEVYDRVWNADVVSGIAMPLAREGFMVPPARPARSGQTGTRRATAADILPGQEGFGLAVREGDEIAPAGLYASDRDLFVFLVDPRRGIEVGGRSTMRGVFLRNSEVGDGSLIIDWFDLDNVCGNHIVWGADKHNQIRVRHVGADTMKRAMARYEIEARRFDASAGEREGLIGAARRKVIAATKAEILEAVVKFVRVRALPLPAKMISAALDVAEQREDRYGDPRTVWALSSGLTEHSQTFTNTSDRHAIDVAAGKILEMAF